jgi:hypothetical protein
MQRTSARLTNAFSDKTGFAARVAMLWMVCSKTQRSHDGCCSSDPLTVRASWPAHRLARPLRATNAGSRPPSPPPKCRQGVAEPAPSWQRAQAGRSKSRMRRTVAGTTRCAPRSSARPRRTRRSESRCGRPGLDDGGSWSAPGAQVLSVAFHPSLPIIAFGTSLSKVPAPAQPRTLSA